MNRRRLPCPVVRWALLVTGVAAQLSPPVVPPLTPPSPGGGAHHVCRTLSAVHLTALDPSGAAHLLACQATDRPHTAAVGGAAPQPQWCTQGYGLRSAVSESAAAASELYLWSLRVRGFPAASDTDEGRQLHECLRGAGDHLPPRTPAAPVAAASIDTNAITANHPVAAPASPTPPPLCDASLHWLQQHESVVAHEVNDDYAAEACVRTLWWRSAAVERQLTLSLRPVTARQCMALAEQWQRWYAPCLLPSAAGPVTDVHGQAAVVDATTWRSDVLAVRWATTVWWFVSQPDHAWTVLRLLGLVTAVVAVLVWFVDLWWGDWWLPAQRRRRRQQRVVDCDGSDGRAVSGLVRAQPDDTAASDTTTAATPPPSGVSRRATAASRNYKK